MPKTKARTRTATHRPAVQRRWFRHDDLIAVDLLSGFGGLTKGIEEAGFTTILAANHNPYKVDVHEANHPHVEHWIADLVDPDASDYHSAADLPAADLLVSGISCTSHSGANTKKAYEQGLTLFDLEDPEYDERVTKSERERATALCILQYARKNHPRMILIECTTEFTSWGPALPNRPKVGDGTTYRWWLNELGLLNYNHKIMYLNSMFFGVGQSRDRFYAVFWDKGMPAPDLEHRPETWCWSCDQIVEAEWTWRTGIPPTGVVRYGVQYNYRCPRCRAEVVPPSTPSLDALDLTDLGTRIGDKPLKTFPDGFVGPMARSTMARAERCRRRFPDFPAILMPAKAVRGVERHPWQPMSTQTSQQETGLLSTGAVMVAAGNTYERPGSDCRSRGLSEPLWTQPATNTTALLTPPVALTGSVFAAHRHNGDGKHVSQPMDTNTSTYEKAVLFAAVNNFQGAPRGVDEPLPTQGGSETLSLLSAGVLPYRRNTVPAVHGEAMPTVTSDQVPGLLSASGDVAAHGMIMQLWRAVLSGVLLEDCRFRMLFKYEVGRACGFDPDFPGRPGTFQVWGSARDQIDGYGNAVSPAVGTWIGRRLRAALHSAPLSPHARATRGLIPSPQL